MAIIEPYNDENWLRYNFVELQLSTRQIAKLAGVSAPTIRSRLKKFGIASRSITEGLLLRKEYISNYSKQYWSNKTNRINHSTKLKTIQARRKQQLSKSAKENWRLNREAILAGIKKSTTITKKQKISKSAKKSWTIARRKTQSLISKKLWENPEYQAKRALSLNSVTNTDTFKRKISENSKRLWQSSNYKERMAQGIANHSPTSILEHTAKHILLNDYGIDAKPTCHGPWSFDISFMYNNRNILIECQGTYWHSLPDKITRDQQKKTYYEKYLSKHSELYYLYEHEFYGRQVLKQRLQRILQVNRHQITGINLKCTESRLIDKNVAQTFFDAYHYLKYGRSGVNIGCFYQDKLIACATYSSVTRLESAKRLNLKSSEILELNRFCIHPDYQIKNLASRFLSTHKQFIPSNVKILLAFSDLGAGHRGTIYRAANWKPDGQTGKSYWYVNANGDYFHKKTVWNQAKRLRMAEKEYATIIGAIKCHGLPCNRFIYQIS